MVTVFQISKVLSVLCMYRMLTFQERGLLFKTLKSSVSESDSFLNTIDFMADGGPARQPGKPEKRALCIEEGGQLGEAAKKWQETPQANKNVADFLCTWRT